MRTAYIGKLERTVEAREKNGHTNGLQPNVPTDMLTFAEAKEVAEMYGFKSPVSVGFGMYVVIDTVTPAVAMRILQSHNEKNRFEKASHIERLAREMEENYWHLNHQGIALDEAGDLLDGQHRLGSVVKTGKPINTMIFIYKGRSVVNSIDAGVTRNYADHKAMVGMPTISFGKQAVLRMFLTIDSGRSRHSSSDLDEIIETAGPVVDWVIKQFPTWVAGVTRATVLAAIASAYGHVSEEKLARFCKVLYTQAADSADPAEQTIVNLLRWLINNKSTRSGTVERRDEFLRTQRAIQAYAAGEALKYSRPSQTLVYPVSFGKPVETA